MSLTNPTNRQRYLIARYRLRTSAGEFDEAVAEEFGKTLRLLQDIERSVREGELKEDGRLWREIRLVRPVPSIFR